MKINRPKLPFSDLLGLFLFGLMPLWLVLLFKPVFYNDTQAAIAWVGVCLIVVMPMAVWLAFWLGRATAFDQLDAQLNGLPSPAGSEGER